VCLWAVKWAWHPSNKLALRKKLKNLHAKTLASTWCLLSDESGIPFNSTSNGYKKTELKQICV